MKDSKYVVTAKGKKLIEDQVLFYRLCRKFLKYYPEVHDEESTQAGIDANWLGLFSGGRPIARLTLLEKSGEEERELTVVLNGLLRRGLIRVE